MTTLAYSNTSVLQPILLSRRTGGRFLLLGNCSCIALLSDIPVRCKTCISAMTCMGALMPRAQGCAGAAPGGHPCVDLASQCNAESTLGVSTRPAGSVMLRRVVVALAKGVAIPCARRLAAEHDRFLQSGHILVKRVLRYNRRFLPFGLCRSAE